jgi:hypothetical protein
VREREIVMNCYKEFPHIITRLVLLLMLLILDFNFRRLLSFSFFMEGMLPDVSIVLRVMLGMAVLAEVNFRTPNLGHAFQNLRNNFFNDFPPSLLLLRCGKLESNLLYNFSFGHLLLILFPSSLDDNDEQLAVATFEFDDLKLVLLLNDLDGFRKLFDDLFGFPFDDLDDELDDNELEPTLDSGEDKLAFPLFEEFDFEFAHHLFHEMFTLLDNNLTSRDVAAGQKSENAGRHYRNFFLQFMVDFLDGFLFDFLDKLGGLHDDDFVAAWCRAVTVRRRRQERRFDGDIGGRRDNSTLGTRVPRLPAAIGVGDGWTRRTGRHASIAWSSFGYWGRTAGRRPFIQYLLPVTAPLPASSRYRVWRP